jgi:serine/threonine-protein kinase
MDRSEFEQRVGTTLRDKWTLEKLIGVGGMAAVYLARHKIGRVEAVKLLHPELTVDDQVRARFEQEAMAVNSIGHPGVVEVRDIDVTDDGTHFMVMELLDGETLADRYERDGKLPLGWLMDVTDHVLDVLVACHAKSIIHRDIKPENIFLQSDGRVKVLDFGIARMREGMRTEAGTMLGTVAFSSPEQIRGGPLDARADLFSVGATLFTVLAGRRVHETALHESLALKMMTEPAPSLAKVAPSLPAPLCMFVDRALAFMPDHRYPDARTMRGDLWSVRKGERPPYAVACEKAGMRADATTPPSQETRKEPSPKSAPPAGETRALPTTAPQLPAYLEESLSDLEPTRPQMPIFIEPQTESSPVRSSEGGTRISAVPSPSSPPVSATASSPPGSASSLAGQVETDELTLPEDEALDEESPEERTLPVDDAAARKADEVVERAEQARQATLRGGYKSPRRYKTDRGWPAVPEGTASTERKEPKRRGDS